MRNHKYTLGRIAAERAEIKRQLKKKKAQIAHDVALIGAPPAADGNPLGFWMNNVGRAVAVYDGVMTGYRLMRTFSGLFAWRRRKKK